MSSGNEFSHFLNRPIMDPYFFVVACVHTYVQYDMFGLFCFGLGWGGVLCVYEDGETGRSAVISL